MKNRLLNLVALGAAALGFGVSGCGSHEIPVANAGPTQASPTTSAPLGPVTPGLSTNSIRINFSSGGMARSYLLHVPPAAPPGPRPLIIAFHDAGQTTGQFEQTIGLDSAADRAGLYVAYPVARARVWMYGEQVDIDPQHKQNDVAMTAELIRDVNRHYAIDENRVVVAGLGDGAVMALRDACDRPDLFTGVVAVSGSLLAGAHVPVPTKPISAVFVHGTADQRWPFSGSVARGLMPVEQAVATFRTVDGLVGAAHRSNVRDRDPHDGMTVRRIAWGSRSGGIEVRLYVIKGGGSTWPGSDNSATDSHGNGRVNRDIDLSGIIEHFAVEHWRQHMGGAVPP